MTLQATKARCSCGSVEIDALGPPIMCVSCYCDDCQEAARRLEAAPGHAPLRTEDGGTPFVVFRKDRVTVRKGNELLDKFKLRESSPTNRWIARCCDSAMLLDFDDSKHWVDVYRERLSETKPLIEMLVCTRFRDNANPIRTDIPGYSSYPLRFIARLIRAKVAMMIRPGPL
jgi:hypothetical protein